MIICPDCHNAIKQDIEKCNHCSWQLHIRDGYPCYFSSKDQQNDFFKKYLDNYDSIGEDDLAHSIQSKEYLEAQTQKMATYIDNVQGKVICELGIGQGLLLEQLQTQSPKEVVGVDICVPYLKHLHTKFASDALKLVIANAENIPFENHFDILVAADILEHVLNVGDFLHSAHRALKPDGKLVLKVPYMEDINMYSTQKGCPYDFVHLRNFSKKTLRLLVENAGFKIEKYYFDGFHWGRNRLYLEKFPRLAQRVHSYIISRFQRKKHEAIMNNFLGGMFMKPIEVTIVANPIKES